MLSASSRPTGDVSCGNGPHQVTPVFPESQDADGAARPAPVVITVSPSRDGVGRKVFGIRGQLFDAAIDERVIVTRSTQPLLDAARFLFAEGADPDARLELWHVGQDCRALRSTLGVAAGLTAYDDGIGKPIFARWKSRSQDGVSTAAGGAWSAEKRQADHQPIPHGAGVEEVVPLRASDVCEIAREGDA